jgi:osmotically-inducible protein OsmY
MPMAYNYRMDEDRWSNPNEGDWRRRDRGDYGQADFSRDDQWRDRSSYRSEHDFARQEGFMDRGRDHDRDDDHGDRGYRPFGSTGRTYYGEGRGYDRDGRHRFDDYGERRDFSRNDRFYGGSGYGSERFGGFEGGSRDRDRDSSGRWFGGSDRDHEWGSNPRAGRGEGGRNAWDKTKDEVKSWFGSESAERRRDWDKAQGEHRGRGPKNYTRSDERIRDDVNDRLSDDSWLDASNIEVSVQGGEVTLSGTVTSRSDKRRAEDLAESCSGVKHVQNNLRLQASAQGGSEQGSLWQSSDRSEALNTTGTASGRA